MLLQGAHGRQDVVPEPQLGDVVDAHFLPESDRKQPVQQAQLLRPVPVLRRRRLALARGCAEEVSEQSDI